jgi:hypothetical protein
MQDFAAITHRHITPPDTSASQMSNPMVIWGMVAASIVALFIAGFVLMNLLFGNSGAIETPPPTETAIPTAINTSIPNRLLGLAVYDFLSGIEALAEPVDTSVLMIPPAEDSPLQYLRVGLGVDGFIVTMDIASTEQVNRYGLAFRIQDAENYLLFTVEPESAAWVFSEVVNGESRVVQGGTLAGVPQRLIFSGYGSFLQVEAGSETIRFESEQFTSGSLAIYVEGDGAVLMLDTLSVALIGQDAELAAEASPTPFAGIPEPRRFLHSDVAAMLQANDIANSAINCPTYIDIYESLERHLDSMNSTVRVLAQETIEVGEVVYTRCRSESPDAALSFVTTIQDYLEWEENLRGIQQELGG